MLLPSGICGQCRVRRVKAALIALSFHFETLLRLAGRRKAGRQLAREKSVQSSNHWVGCNYWVLEHTNDLLTGILSAQASDQSNEELFGEPDLVLLYSDQRLVEEECA